MYFLLTILLASVCFTGDSILKVANNDAIRALVDNGTHCAIGVLSWLIVLLKCHSRSSLILNSIFELVLSGLIASLIDLDHFILAKSFKLKNALHLGKKRPVLHCTSVPVVILVVCLAVGWTTGSARVWRFGWLTAVSILSHHIRDGSRRGIWLWPFGSTPPIPHYLYILLTLSLPYLVMIPLNDQKNKSYSFSSSSVDYVSV